MNEKAVEYLLISLFGMFIFIGIERLLDPMLISPFILLAVGVVLIIFSKKFPFDFGIPRLVGGVLIFITLKPYIIQYISSAFIFIGVGAAGLVFLDKLIKIVDKFI